MSLAEIEEQVALKCYHCGDDIITEVITFDNRNFCCASCQTVYEILSQGDMGEYYKLNQSPGKAQKVIIEGTYDFLDNEQTANSLLNFNDGKLAIVTLYLPEIHCSSCIWLLENLFKIDNRITSVEVNFLQKEALIRFNPTKISLKEVAILLSKIGYPPSLSYDDLSKKVKTNPMRAYYYKLGVAFFAFGNIMLLSFPDYFGLGELNDPRTKVFFGYMNFLLSLPVLFYSAQEFFQSAWQGLKQKTLNMDFPIVLGLIVMFVRSSYEIFSQTGAGFMDTLASLVFLMLIGRMFKNKSYNRISYDRDYRSYFPIAVNRIIDGKESSIKISEIQKGDLLRIRNGELIPADSILKSANATVDYSFVTGEANDVLLNAQENLFAGGRNKGKSIEIEAQKSVSQSYLTSLWNNEAFDKQDDDNLTTLANKVSGIFTVIVVVIAIAALVYWYPIDLTIGINAFTAVLIITCPCALALSSPFTLGSVIRVLGRNNIYLKNTNVIEKLAKIDTIIFDKTGTITQSKVKQVQFVPINDNDLDSDELDVVKAACSHSGHTLSRMIYNELTYNKSIVVSSFKEEIGFGIEAVVNDIKVRIGSAKYIGFDSNSQNPTATQVFVKIDEEIKGYFEIKSTYRDGLNKLINKLSQKFNLFLLSGDNDNEKENLGLIFPKENLYFNQKPQDKLNKIKELNQSQHTMMVGDGLNDAGALKQSFVGIAITDEIGNFFPSSDAVIDSKEFTKLNTLLEFAKSAKSVIIFSFLLSFAYNTLGIYYAVTGKFSPVVAAIIMPISSVTIILFTTMTVSFLAKRKGL